MGLKKRLKENSKNVVVGIPDGAGNYPGGPSVRDVAFWNHIGAVAPPRPFVSETVQKKNHEYRRMLTAIVRLIIVGSIGVMRAYRNLGSRGKLDIQNAIEAWETPPNSDKWAEKKGFNNPLIHTRKMKKTFDFWIEDLEDES